MKSRILIILSLTVNSHIGHSQGFVNLDFEQARIVINPGYGAYASNAIPGWTAYIDGVPQTYIVYNSLPLSNPAVTLQGPGGHESVAGQYCVSLWGEYRPLGGPGASAAIGQTGQIPLSARFLVVWGTLPLQVTFKGQGLGFQQTGAGPTYGIYSADVSPYAGQTGELRFTTPVNQGWLLDNIQFVVPEPSVSWLLAAGVMFFGCQLARKAPHPPSPTQPRAAGAMGESSTCPRQQRD